MNKFIFALAIMLFFTACTIKIPNQASSTGGYVVAELKTDIKIVKTAELSYDYEVDNIGCSEVEFIDKYVGKKIRTKDGSQIRVDNILNIHKHAYSERTTFLFFFSKEHFYCRFRGLAVEYSTPTE